MQRPTWATIVGIIGIIMGCFGILAGGQFIMMPRMMEMQKEMWSAVQESLEEQKATDARQMPPPEMLKFMEKAWDVPDWFDTYCLIAGITALFVSGFYVFASIRLLQTTPTAIQLFYCAIGLAVGFAILKALVAMATMSLVGMGMMMGGMFGVVINVVLLIVVITGNKEAFASQPAQQDLPLHGTY